MSHNWDSGGGHRGGKVGGIGATLEFNGVATGLFKESSGVKNRLFNRVVIERHERHISDDERVWSSSSNRLAVVQGLLDSQRQSILISEHSHSE